MHKVIFIVSEDNSGNVRVDFLPGQMSSRPFNTKERISSTEPITFNNIQEFTIWLKVWP